MSNRAMESRIEEAARMRCAGHAAADIAARMGLNIGSLYCYLRVARTQRGLDVPRGHAGRRPGAAVVLVPDLCAALRPHAKARGINVSTLALRILEAVAAPDEGDPLIDAVLDDGEGGDA